MNNQRSRQNEKGRQQGRNLAKSAERMLGAIKKFSFELVAFHAIFNALEVLLLSVAD